MSTFTDAWDSAHTPGNAPEDRDPAACTCAPASAFFPAEPDDTCPQHRSYDPEEG